MKTSLELIRRTIFDSWSRSCNPSELGWYSVSIYSAKFYRFGGRYLEMLSQISVIS